MPGCREVVEEGVNGLLVQPRDAEGLSRAIRTLLNDKERRTRMGVASRQRAEEAFGIEKVTTQTLAIYAELLPNARPRG